MASPPATRRHPSATPRTGCYGTRRKTAHPDHHPHPSQQPFRIADSAAERLVIARRWSGDLPGRRPAADRLSGPRKFIAFYATKFKHATFVGLPAVIVALGAVD